MKKIAVVASGGNSPGMNNCLQGVARACQVHGVHLVVIHDGFAGIVARNFSVYQPGPQLIDYLYAQSGVVFSGSGRFEEMKTLPVQQQVVQILSETGIEGLIVIGGNGSYRGAVALSRLGVKCIALPGTIDNDITTTDFTIGFPTASEFLLNFLDRLRDCAESQKYCFVVEVMGRHCGDLAIYAGIAGLVDFIVTKTNYQKPASIIQRVQQ